MKKLIINIFVILCPLLVIAQEYEDTIVSRYKKHLELYYFTEDAAGFFSNRNVIKLSPAIFKGIVPKGINVYYEKGFGNKKFSINLVYRYFAGTGTPETSSYQEVSVPEHSRFELQPRYWVYRQFNKLFVSPVLAVYHTGDIAGGFTVGYFAPLSKHLIAEFFVGMQTAGVEVTLNPIYLRYGINIGYFWKCKKKKKN